jgi:excinuclease ABC subunit A
MSDFIELHGVRTHNLKNIHLKIPKGKITSVIGVCGAGKHSLVFDTLYAESYYRTLESISPYIRQFMDKVERPDIDWISGLPAAISSRHKKPANDPGSMVATAAGIYSYLKILYAGLAQFYCPNCQIPVSAYTIDEITDFIISSFYEEVIICFPYQGELNYLFNRGFYYCCQDQIIEKITGQNRADTMDILIDQLMSAPQNRSRIFEAVERAFQFGRQRAVVYHRKKRWLFSGYLYCSECKNIYDPPQENLFSLIRKNKELSTTLEGRFKAQALSYKINAKSLADYLAMTISHALAFMKELHPLLNQRKISPVIYHEILNRLQFLADCNLSCLTLNRPLLSLSSGELQRINLAFLLGSALADSLIILDQPSAGLHPDDSNVILTHLRKLTELGNTIVMIEHQQNFIESSDYIIELGPLFAEFGGRITFCGNQSEFQKTRKSITNRFFKFQPIHRTTPRKALHWTSSEQIHARNLKGLEIKIPKHCLTVISGVSASGKSTLLEDLYRCHFQGIFSGKHHIDSHVMRLDQRRTVSSFFDILPDIRKIFSNLKESKLLHYTANHFSTTSPVGQCPECKGKGETDIDMQFLPSICMICPACQGSGIQAEMLKVKYNDKNFFDLMQLSIRQLLKLLGDKLSSKNRQILATIKRNGMGYLKVGQKISTLADGQIQRLHLLRCLNKKNQDTLFLIDTPSKGLHPFDVRFVVSLIDTILKNNNTVIVADNHPQFIQKADYIINLDISSKDSVSQICFQENRSVLTEKKNPNAVKKIKST